MNCPYCGKEIYGLTGMIEVQNFHNHLPKCKKNPKNKVVVLSDGSMNEVKDNSTLFDALTIRAESGQ